jgi:hypothetical protein
MVSSQQGYANTTTDMKGNTAAVNEAQSNLPLPEQPPVASDFNSSEAAKKPASRLALALSVSPRLVARVLLAVRPRTAFLVFQTTPCRVIKRTTRALRILRARTMDILRRMTPAASSRWLLVEN